MDEKKPEVTEYEKPEIVDYGDLVQLTAGGQSGSYLDATFQQGTPRGKLTFS
jgi:hypothetical protein